MKWLNHRGSWLSARLGLQPVVWIGTPFGQSFIFSTLISSGTIPRALPEQSRRHICFWWTWLKRLRCGIWGNQDQMAGMWGGTDLQRKIRNARVHSGCSWRDVCELSHQLYFLSESTNPLEKTLSFLRALPSTLSHAEVRTFTWGLTSSPHHFLSIDQPANDDEILCKTD